MSETTVALRSPLEDIELADRPAVATLTDIGPRLRFVIRGNDVVAASLAGSIGVVPPTAINRATVAGSRAALKLGPDEWLLLAEPAGDLQLDPSRTTRLSLIEISHRNADDTETVRWRNALALHKAWGGAEEDFFGTPI